jgi:adenine phosphoribosyltransferase
MNNIEKLLKESIRNVPDFPKPGIQFKDITTALKNAEILHKTADYLYDNYKNMGITKVVGIESRGFILGSILAYKLNAGFVLLRKQGKLPADTFAVEYALEYGSDKIEIHKDSLCAEDVVLLHDDLLATGGSANAAIDLIKIFNTKELHLNFLIELDFLEGQKRLKKVDSIFSLIHF